MSYMKYIRFQDIGFVLFERSQQHAAVVKMFGRVLQDVVSAGQVVIMDGEVRCFGESMTLNCSSKKDEDSRLLSRVMGV